MARQKMKKDDGGAQPSFPAAPTEAQYAASLERGADEEVPARVLLFFVEGAQYALPIDNAIEVMRPKSVTEVPRTPAFVLGVFSVRGDMIPVVDLSSRLGLVSKVPYDERKVVVAMVDGLKVAFVVEKLGGVREILMSELKPVEALFVKGTVNRDGRSILMLDSAKLLDFNLKPS
ncbi:MAG: chemotaxis protein CheW [Nitrospirota bacterium]|nr:chemotaxis protein CheW [Nitrospirota bacterium]